MSETLTYSERMERIGEILAIGVGRYRMLKNGDEAFVEDPKRLAVRSRTTPKRDDGNLVVQFLAKVHQASPLEIRNRFGWSRTTAYRRLKELESDGRVIRCGTSRDAVYELPSRSTSGGACAN